MKTIKVHDLTLNDQVAKIAVPITGGTTAEIKEQASQINSMAPDLVEWRIDFLVELQSANLAFDLKIIRDQLPMTPIIATIRTSHEGGHFDQDDQTYLQLIQTLVSLPIDLIDIEVDRPRSIVTTAISAAHSTGIEVIGSYHQFQNTPDDHTLLAKFNQMQQLGCDIAKVAVMPNDATDTLRLMQISNQANQTLSIPIISMAMGKTGMLTRISTMLTGSIISFASTDQHHQSAPGQLSFAQLRTIMQIIN
ncbi:type I 3-dehydroquinate dehydratase [Nicoliella lavandulae]|uniref:3-dehydroquinate dehydratase n=1 Tax=Nicoliella lavandulae TaxID=3082954 RepID=A0ABU8SMJ3_9LACO